MKHIKSAADSVSPGSIMKAMPGDTPGTTPIKPISSPKIKVVKVPMKPKVLAKGEKKIKKVKAGGPGSGRKEGEGFKVTPKMNREQLSHHIDEKLKEDTSKVKPGARTDLTYDGPMVKIPKRY